MALKTYRVSLHKGPAQKVVKAGNPRVAINKALRYGLLATQRQSKYGYTRWRDLQLKMGEQITVICTRIEPQEIGD